MKEIYVLVAVHYDHFRFQENLYVGSKEQCLKKISDLFTNHPIYTYDNLDSDLAKELHDKEREHYWLQKFIIE